MKTFSPAYRAHKSRTLTTTTRCSRVERRDGGFILGTELDRVVEITTGPRAGIYRPSAGIRSSDVKATSDMSITNMEITGVTTTTQGIPFRFTRADIKARLYDTAPVEIFEVNYEDPDDFQDVIFRGFLGEIRETDEGALTTEIRGLWQKANQQLGRTYGALCDVVHFGDSRCKVDREALRVTGTVTAVVTKRRFTVLFNYPDDPRTGEVRLWEPFPREIVIGDQVSGTPGCIRTFEACLGYGNAINFRGHGRWAPGSGAFAYHGPSTTPSEAFQAAIANADSAKEFFRTAGEFKAGGGGGSPPAVPPGIPAQLFEDGEIRFETGDNAGLVQQIQLVDFDV